MPDGRVDQLLAGLNARDAVGNFARALQARLRAAGAGSEIFAGYGDEPSRGGWRPAADLNPAPGDTVILHYSTGHDVNNLAAGLRCRRVLYYHNVTPAGYCRDASAAVAAEAERGRRELAALVARFDAWWANSEYSAAELRAAGAGAVAIVPPIARDPETIAAAPPPRPDGRLTLLFVGRIAPHKGDRLLIDTLRALRSELGAAARLVRLGGGDPGYVGRVRSLARAAGVEADCLLPGRVDDAALAGWYRAADVFVCASEHEGFCVPLVEAMAHRVPIVALDRTAVGETLAGSGVLVGEPDPRVLARLAVRLVRDAGLRDAVLTAQDRVRERYRAAAVQARMLQLLGRAAAGAAA